MGWAWGVGWGEQERLWDDASQCESGTPLLAFVFSFQRTLEACGWLRALQLRPWSSNAAAGGICPVSEAPWRGSRGGRTKQCAAELEAAGLFLSLVEEAERLQWQPGLTGEAEALGQGAGQGWQVCCGA